MGKKSVAHDKWNDIPFHKEDRWSKKQKYRHLEDEVEFEKRKSRHQKQSRYKIENDE